MIRAIVREEHCRDGIGIWIMDERREGTHVAKSVALEMEPMGEGAFVLPDPTFKIRREEAQPFLQSLINELVRLGIRSDSDRTAGELDASKKNLEDFRGITSKLLGILERK